MSEQYLLQKNDIIRLEKGMRVYASIPKKFIFMDTPFSSKISKNAIICIGNIRRRHVPHKEQFILNLSDFIKSQLDYDGVTLEQISAFVDSLNLDFTPEEFDTSIFAGEYRVYQAHSTSGCTRYTSNGAKNFHAGWHVCCEKLDDPKIRVHFYQTGSFSTKIPDIKPIRHEN